MKKVFVLFAFCAVAAMANAQVMGNQKPVWVSIFSNNLKCYTCKEILDNYLTKANKVTFEGGLLEWRFNIIKGEVKFKYIPDRVAVDDIRVVMNNAGFDADSTKAVKEVYAKLPPICKRAEDGGGPTKGKPCHQPPLKK